MENNLNKDNIKIILQNGVVIPCKSFGKYKEVYGRFIFNTSIVGYQETLTDPSYKDEILVMTFPIQGIYGINDLDNESDDIHLSAFVVNNYENHYSNNYASKSLEEFLIQKNVLGVYDADTRYLTKIIRDFGSLKGAIVNIQSDKQEVLEKIKNWEISKNQEIKAVSPKKITILNSSGTKKILFYDFGAKNNIKNHWIKRGYQLIVVPYDTKIIAIMKKYKFDFVFLSNGPGNPSDLKDVIIEIKKMFKLKLKLVGICLGHQLLGLALNAEVLRLKFGHHSTNHPVKNLENNSVYITSQNHNYGIKNQKLSKDINVFLRSLNDNAIEGMKSEKYNFISTQFHPESSPGPNDSNIIFDLFVKFHYEREQV